MGITPLSAKELGIGDLDAELAEHPPLWFYALEEAELLEGGRVLGPVGDRIVAEVLLGLLAHDPLSYVNVELHWTPVKLMAEDDGSFDMPQLIRFAMQPQGRRSSAGGPWRPARLTRLLRHSGRRPVLAGLSSRRAGAPTGARPL
jgi:hypothetical protein